MALGAAQRRLEYSYLKRQLVVVSRIYDDDFVLLKEDPGPWIERNLPHSLSIRTLELYEYDGERIGESIAQLAQLTYLSINLCSKLKCVSNVMMLHNLQVLIIKECPKLEELPENLGDLSITTLKLESCASLEELPENLGDLRNLTHLEVSYCEAIKCLPNSIAHLFKLSTLIVKGCESLEALPANLNVVKMVLNCCFCPLEQCLSIFTGLRNLQRLWLYLAAEKFPINLDEVPQLVLLDVSQCDEIKYLPSNIKDLHKLRFLYLPRCFILETLPSHLNDSVIISVEDIHIRKTWKELKLEMGPKFIQASPPLVDMVMETTQNCSSSSAWGYLSLKEDPSTWILNHYNLCSMVQFLDLQLQDNIAKIADVIWALPNLTHLYISPNCYRQKLCLPYKTTRLIHLSLDSCESCDLDYLSKCLGNLSNLKSLDLSLVTYKWMNFTDVRHFQTIPESVESLVSLEHLTLRRLDSSLPNSLAKLCNLNTLELHLCCNVSLFPEFMNLTKLKLVDCSVESLPSRLCHLEIVHGRIYCFKKCGKAFKMFLMKLPVNLKTLSLTCWRVEYLPSITALHLQIILFKECLDLRELMPNIDKLVELCTLDISDTSIESLPECITRLPKLQHLVLPKCFKPTNLPLEFLRNDSNLKIEYVDDGIQREVVKEDIIYEQSSSCRLPIPPEVLEGNHMSGQNSACENSHYAKDSKGIIPLLSPIENTSYFGEEGHAITMDLGKKEPNIAPSSGDDIKEEHNMTITELAKTFSGFHVKGRECLEMESSSTGVQAMVVGGDSIGVRPFAHDSHDNHGVLNTHNNSNPCGALEKINKQKIEITREHIQSLRDENMSLVEAAKKLGVSRSTMKRRCKELQLGEWPSSRKKRNINTKLPYGSELSQPNLVECTNQVVPKCANACLDGNLCDLVAPECDPVDNSPKATIRSVEELNVATHKHMDVHKSAPEVVVRREIHQLSGTTDFPWCSDVPDFILSDIKGWTDVERDGNCGFRVIAAECYDDEGRWPDVREKMSNEMVENTNQYDILYAQSHEATKAILRISGHKYGPASQIYWIQTPLDLYSASTAFCVAFVLLTVGSTTGTQGCTTVLPLRSWSGAKGPKKVIGIAHVKPDHYVLVHLSDHCPLPPLVKTWEKAKHESVAGWNDIYSSRMQKWNSLRGNVDQRNVFDQGSSKHNPINVSSPEATKERVGEEINTTIDRHMDVSESIPEVMIGTHLRSLSELRPFQNASPDYPSCNTWSSLSASNQRICLKSF